MPEQKLKQNIKLNIGAVITESGNSIKNKTGAWRALRPKVLKDRCTGCVTCSQNCPDACIKIKSKKAEVDYNHCKGCGICAKECPAKAIIMQKEEN